MILYVYVYAKPRTALDLKLFLTKLSFQNEPCSKFSQSCILYFYIFSLPGINIVELDKELAPNDLSLPFDDVTLIIGILYCVGVVEISPPRIQTLLVAAQILGIPTLIRFLKRIKDTMGQNRTLVGQQMVETFPNPFNTENSRYGICMIPNRRTY